MKTIAETPFIAAKGRSFGRRYVMPERTAVEVENALIAELQAARRRGDPRAVLRVNAQLARILD